MTIIKYLNQDINFEIPEQFTLKENKFRLPKKKEYFLGINKKGEFNLKASYDRSNNCNNHPLLGHLRPILQLKPDVDVSTLELIIDEISQKNNFKNINKNLFTYKYISKKDNKNEFYKEYFNLYEPYNHLIIAFDKNEPIGYACINKSYLNIFVLEEYRLKGIGTEMIKKLRNYTKAISLIYHSKDDLLYKFAIKNKFIKLVYKRFISSEDEFDSIYNKKLIIKENIVSEEYYNIKMQEEFNKNKKVIKEVSDEYYNRK